MLVALLLLVAAAADYRRKDECPTVACSTYLETTMCGWLDNTDYSFLVQPCSLGFSCEPASLMSSQDMLQCVPEQDLYGFSFSTVMQLDLLYHKPGLLGAVGTKDGAAPRTLGDTCYTEDAWCARDQGTVCHCSEQCRCVVAGQLDERCSEDMTGEYPGCAWGLGCHAGYCVPWFSVSRGLVVSDPWLCESMQTYDDGSCVPSEASTWNITEPCTTNSQCVGSAGTATMCTCGMMGKAYCPPFSLDAPYASLKSAILSGDLAGHARYRMLIDNWAQLQRSDGRGNWTDHPACVGDVWSELNLQLKDLQYHEDIQGNAADWLGLAGVAVILGY